MAPFVHRLFNCSPLKSNPMTLYVILKRASDGVEWPELTRSP